MDDVIQLRLTDFTYPEGHPLARAHGVVFGYVVRHPEGAFLFDTGIGSGDPQVDRRFGVVRTDLAQALRELGLDRERVVGIANSHLHLDHCGQNRLFPGVPIHTQRAEYESAQRPRYTIRDWIDFPGANYRLLDGDSEPLPGVRVLATPGHTAGHQSLVVDTSEGPVVLAGHAIYSRDEYLGKAEPAERSEESQRSARRLRDLRPRRVYFGHDADVWEA